MLFFPYFYFRSVSYKELPEFKHQATMVWPQASKKPANAVPVAADELNQTIIRFSVESSRSKSHSFLNNLLSKSSSPTPSQTSSSGNSIRLPSASNGKNCWAISRNFRYMQKNDWLFLVWNSKFYVKFQISGCYVFSLNFRTSRIFYSCSDPNFK